MYLAFPEHWASCLWQQLIRLVLWRSLLIDLINLLVNVAVAPKYNDWKHENLKFYQYRFIRCFITFLFCPHTVLRNTNNRDSKFCSGLKAFRQVWPVPWSKLMNMMNLWRSSFPWSCRCHRICWQWAWFHTRQGMNRVPRNKVHGRRHCRRCRRTFHPQQPLLCPLPLPPHCCQSPCSWSWFSYEEPRPTFEENL